GRITALDAQQLAESGVVPGSGCLRFGLQAGKQQGVTEVLEAEEAVLGFKAVYARHGHATGKQGLLHGEKTRAVLVFGWCIHEDVAASFGMATEVTTETGVTPDNPDLTLRRAETCGSAKGMKPGPQGRAALLIGVGHRGEKRTVTAEDRGIMPQRPCLVEGRRRPPPDLFDHAGR